MNRRWLASAACGGALACSSGARAHELEARVIGVTMENQRGTAEITAVNPGKEISSVAIGVIGRAGVTMRF